MKIVSTGTTYKTHAVASSQVVAGEKLNIPFNTAPYQLDGGTAALTSNARL